MIFRTKYKRDAGRYMTYCSGDGYLSAVVLMEWRHLVGICSNKNRLDSFEGKPVQRSLNKARARKFANYLLERIRNKERFVIPPLVMTMLVPNLSWYSEQGQEWPDEDEKIFSPNRGDAKKVKQVLPAGTTVIVNDGQHRIAGINMLFDMMRTSKKVKKKDLPLQTHDFDSNELVIQVQACFRAEEMQQVFADINANASKPSKSISLFFDNSNPFNLVVKQLVDSHIALMGKTDIEKNTVSGKSDKMFTIAGLTSAFRAFFPEKAKDEGLAEQEVTLLSEVLFEVNDLWQLMGKTAEEHRAYSLSTHAVYMKALFGAIRELVEVCPDSWKDILAGQGIPHRRDDKSFLHRCVGPNGKVLADNRSMMLTRNVLKQYFELPLESEEVILENEHKAYLATMAEQTEYGK